MCLKVSWRQTECYRKLSLKMFIFSRSFQYQRRLERSNVGASSEGESIYHRFLKNSQEDTRSCSRFGCAAKLSQQLPLIIFHCPREKTILAASDVEKFHSGHRRYLFEHQKLQLNMSKTEFIVQYRNGPIRYRNWPVRYRNSTNFPQLHGSYARAS